MEDIKMIQAIVIVILSIAVLFCSKCVYDLNKRISTMERRYDSMFKLNDITRRMIDELNTRYNTQHQILVLLNKKCEQLEQEMDFRW